MLIYWALLQVVGGFGGEGGVAFWAHVGGFVAGMLLIKLFENPRLVAQRNQWRQEEQAAQYAG
jgi:membrane associated rhomboid family serine protease